MTDPAQLRTTQHTRPGPPLLLQALRNLEFPTLEFEVRPIALTVEQAIELGLLAS